MFRSIVRASTRSSTRIFRSQARNALACAPVVSSRGMPSLNSFEVRAFSEGSHPDFSAQFKSISPEEATDMIKQDISENDVFLYMKGTPESPQCGFSRQASLILMHMKVPFASRNVLDNAMIREGIKTFSDWPTIPQLYIKGEFVGGCDIITSMFRDGELSKLLKENDISFTEPTLQNTKE